jgi:hypothetical protein
MPKVKVFETLYGKEDKRINKINKQLPKPVFRWILCGSTGTGKSNLIKNILFSKDYNYKKYFDEIYCFCGSADDLREYIGYASINNMRNKIKFAQNFDDDAVSEIYEGIESDNLRSKKPINALFIFDDQITNDICKPNKMNSLDSIMIKGRHARISCLVSTQKYKALNQNTRKLNTSYVTVFNGTNTEDLESISKDHCGCITPDELMNLFKENLNKPYSFVSIDCKDPTISRFKDMEFNNLLSKEE